MEGEKQETQKEEEQKEEEAEKTEEQTAEEQKDEGETEQVISTYYILKGILCNKWSSSQKMGKI